MGRYYPSMMADLGEPNAATRRRVTAAMVIVTLLVQLFSVLDALRSFIAEASR